MIYKNIVEGIFINRPNRFIANVLINGKSEIAHVKNTGRCREILIEGTKIFLEKSSNPNRKTKYSVISALKGNMLINIDSQVPNDVVYQSINDGKVHNFNDITLLKKEVTYNNSRFDLYFETNEKKGFIEIKGVTLELDGLSMFPDAPTDRGRKHVEEMIRAVEEGYSGFMFFLIQIDGIHRFTPNRNMDKKFSDSLLKAKKSGVEIIAYNSKVTQDEITLGEQIEVLI